MSARPRRYQDRSLVASLYGDKHIECQEPEENQVAHKGDAVMERQQNLSSLLGLKDVRPDSLKSSSQSPVVEKPSLAEDNDADATEVTCDESMTSLDAESWLFSSSKSIKSSRNKVTPLASSASTIIPSADPAPAPDNLSDKKISDASENQQIEDKVEEPTTNISKTKEDLISLSVDSDTKAKVQEDDEVASEDDTDDEKESVTSQGSSTQDRIQSGRETLDFAKDCSARVSEMETQRSTVTNYSKGTLHHLSFEDRKRAREVRLQRALERVRRDKEEAELQKAKEEARRLKERKAKVYSLYMFYDMPSKKKMYKLATRHGLTKHDVDTLPWMKGDKTIDQMAIADIKYGVGEK